jgi:hypothetical protein
MRERYGNAGEVDGSRRYRGLWRNRGIEMLKSRRVWKNIGK